jgi:hypothetical protein
MPLAPREGCAPGCVRVSLHGTLAACVVRLGMHPLGRGHVTLGSLRSRGCSALRRVTARRRPWPPRRRLNDPSRAQRPSNATRRRHRPAMKRKRLRRARSQRLRQSSPHAHPSLRRLSPSRCRGGRGGSLGLLRAESCAPCRANRPAPTETPSSPSSLARCASSRSRSHERTRRAVRPSSVDARSSCQSTAIGSADATPLGNGNATPPPCA